MRVVDHVEVSMPMLSLHKCLTDMMAFHQNSSENKDVVGFTRYAKFIRNNVAACDETRDSTSLHNTIQ